MIRKTAPMITVVLYRRMDMSKDGLALLEVSAMCVTKPAGAFSFYPYVTKPQ